MRKLIIALIGCLVMVSYSAIAQKVVTGKVSDSKSGQGLPGVTVTIKGTSTAVSTEADGSFSINVPSDNSVLVISYVGYTSKEVGTSGGSVNVSLEEGASDLNEVVVVGYGTQKKPNVVGAITTVNNEVLERTGGVSSLGAALTGNLPGVITTASNGMPGEEDPQILIRGRSTWNNAGPLVLVDGVERSINNIDISSVESVTVLKDASATAVFGVKGANGVILITTKRGKDGKAEIRASVNTILKSVSKLPGKYDSYDMFNLRNSAIEYELALRPDAWASIMPMEIMNKYRNPANLEESERYPNVDWVNVLFRDNAMSQNASLNVSGGTSLVKYFTSVDFLHEGDIMKIPDNGKGYKPGFFYDRLNIRANLDFKLTKSTTLSTNISTLYGKRQDTWSGFEYSWYQGIYGLAPDLFYPQYSDGAFGYYPLDPVSTNNPAQILSNNGVRNTKTTQMTTDFILTQDLGMLVKNLSFRGSYSLDNTFVAQGGQFDDGSSIVKWIAPDGRVQYRNTAGPNQFDYIVPQWSVRPDAFQNGQTRRRRVYQLQLNHSAKIGRHNITTMGLFMRNENAQGSSFPEFREDWVFRSTYNFANRYFAEINGAYNGSQRFGPDYRFDFFPSAAVGWTLTNEKFMDKLPWVSTLKIRGSYGLVGNDAIGGNYLYLTQWAFGGQTRMGDNNANSPYVWFRENTIGNPDIHWETVAKANIGLDFSLFRGLIEGTFEVYRDQRTDVLVAGTQRAVPAYFGGTPPTSNLGKTIVQGYEIELKFNKNFGSKREMRLWGNVAITHAKDEIIDRDDPQLLDDYLKQAGYQIGQYRSQLRSGYYNTWDEVYGSSVVDQNDNNKLPGNFNLIDFNGDGVINNFDNVPYAYPERPQNTYTGSVGFDYKRFSIFVQFYAVNNVTRNLAQTNFAANLNSVFKQGDYWTKENTDAASPLPRWKSRLYSYGDFFNYDGSYVRLKTAEISYTLDPLWLTKAGIQSMRLYVNGNNLLFWSKMPDDREANVGSSNFSGQGAYPTVRRINFGINLSL